MEVLIVTWAPWAARLKERLEPACSVALVRDDDAAALERALPRAEILVSGRFDREMARRAGALKLIVCPWAGTENIDRAYVPQGVEVISSGGTEEPIAEYVIATLVAFRRKLIDADRRLRAGDWAYGFISKVFVEEIYGSSLGLFGFGRIGHEVAKRAAAFGLQCRAVTMHPQRAVPPPGLEMEIGALCDGAAVDDLVRWADAVVICCELSDVTRGAFDARRLALMKPGAVLINVARAAVVVEGDLYEALRAKRIAGAILDVWYHYPDRPGAPCAPADHDFAALDNVIMTPHYSGWTEPAVRRRTERIVAAIKAFAARPRT
ncbi:MAG: phosphoglycerate dehydrogenase [Candidatus Eremiobacteraeota bacterium]|nr:phosphoglycerate dehydrogenase [Candidatus Eremiobacteraeota bacterium]